jgi:hypothetical protein
MLSPLQASARAGATDLKSQGPIWQTLMGTPQGLGVAVALGVQLGLGLAVAVKLPAGLGLAVRLGVALRVAVQLALGPALGVVVNVEQYCQKQAGTIRTRPLLRSQMKRLSQGSTVTAPQRSKPADQVGPPSPLKDAVPVPATVWIAPQVSSIRTRLLNESAIKRTPDAPNSRPQGFMPAAVAGPPSPEALELPLPAIVLMIPEESIFRTLKLW